MGTERETQDETFQVHPVNKYEAMDGDIVYMCVTCFSNYKDKNQLINHVRNCRKTNDLNTGTRKENKVNTILPKKGVTRDGGDGDGEKTHPFKNQSGSSKTHHSPALLIKEELVKEDENNLGVAARNENNGKTVIRKSIDGDGKKTHLSENQNGSSTTHQLPALQIKEELVREEDTSLSVAAKNENKFELIEKMKDHHNKSKWPTVIMTSEIERDTTTPTVNSEDNDSNFWMCPVCCSVFEHRVLLENHEIECRAEHGVSVTENLPELAENGISVTARNGNNCYVQNDMVDTNELGSADDIHRRNNSRAKRKSAVNIHSQREACAKKTLTISLGEKVTECQMCHHYFTGRKQFKRHKLLCNEMYEQIERLNKINEEQNAFDIEMEDHTKSDTCTELTEKDGNSTGRIIFTMTNNSCENISEVYIGGESDVTIGGDSDAKTGGETEAYTVGEVKLRLKEKLKLRLKEKVKLRLREKVKLSEAKTGEEVKLRLEGKVKLGLREKVKLSEAKTGGKSTAKTGGKRNAMTAAENESKPGGEVKLRLEEKLKLRLEEKVKLRLKEKVNSEAKTEGESDVMIGGESEGNSGGGSEAHIAGKSDADIGGESDANIRGENGINSEGESDANTGGETEVTIAKESKATIAGESDTKTGGENDSHIGDDSKANIAGEREESCEDSKMQTRMSLRKIKNIYKKSKVQTVNENKIERNQSSNDDTDNESEYTSESDSDSIDSDESWGHRRRKTTSTANRKHECHVCHIKFLNSNHWTSHLRIHSGEKPFECDACHKQFTRSHTLKLHTANKVCVNSNENPTPRPVLPRKPSKKNSFRNKPRPFRCTTCHTRFTTKYNLEAHIRNKTCENHVPDPNKVIVDDSSSSESELDDESEMSTEVMTCCYVENYTKIDTNFECKHCHKTFDSKNKIEYHIKAQEDKMKQRKADYICKICNEEFDMKCKLARHRIVKHNGDKVKCGKKNDNGSECYKTFSNHIKLRAHILSVHPKKRYLCTICGVAMKKQYCLKVHMLTHNTERTFKCTEGTCDKAYTTARQLRNHIRNIHERKINYMCDLCPKTFAKKDNFDIHKRVHSGEQPYKCDICSMKFGAYCSKIRHEVTHTQLKKYVCTVCDKSFTQSQSLKRHMITHTGKTPYRCEPCDLDFPESYRLKLHNEKVHD